MAGGCTLRPPETAVGNHSTQTRNVCSAGQSLAVNEPAAGPFLFYLLKPESQSRVKDGFARQFRVRGHRIQVIILTRNIQHAKCEVTALARETAADQEVDLMERFVGHVRYGERVHNGPRPVLKIEIPIRARKESGRMILEQKSGCPMEIGV